MPIRLTCPACREVIRLDPSPGQATVCPACGVKLNLKAKSPAPPPPPAAARPRVVARPVEVADELVESGYEVVSDDAAPIPAREATGPRPKRKKKRKGAATSRSSRGRSRLYAGVGVGVGLLVLVGIGLFLLIGGPAGPANRAQPADAVAEPLHDIPPVVWTVPPAGPVPPVALPAEVSVAAELPGTLLAIPRGATNEFVGLDARRGSDMGTFVFGRLDAKTGRPAAPPLVLSKRAVATDPATLARTAAVSPTGRLAYHLLADWSGVSVFEPGRADAVKAYAPAGPATATYAGVQWYDWDAADRLWVLDGGTLVAVDGKGGPPAVTAEGRFAPPAVMSPDRKWLAVTVAGEPYGKYVELLDAATGRAVGRVGGEGGWFELSVSPDGRRLAGLRVGAVPPPGGSIGRYDAHLWSVADGQRVGVVSLAAPMSLQSPHQPQLVHCLGGDQVLVGTTVLDVARRVPLVALKPPGRVGSPDGYSELVSVSRDGRVWVRQIPAERLWSVPIPTAPAGGSFALAPGDPLGVVVACDDAAAGKRVQDALAADLARAGYRPGTGGWTLRVTADASKRAGNLTYGSGKSVAIPRASGTLALVAPDGAVVSEAAFQTDWPQGPASKYYVRTDTSSGMGRGSPQTTTTSQYDFGFRDPTAAITDEVWDEVARTIPGVRRPAGVWESGGKYQPLPVTVEVAPPAAAAPKP